MKPIIRSGWPLNSWDTRLITPGVSMLIKKTKTKTKIKLARLKNTPVRKKFHITFSKRKTNRNQSAYYKIKNVQRNLKFHRHLLHIQRDLVTTLNRMCIHGNSPIKQILKITLKLQSPRKTRPVTQQCRPRVYTAQITSYSRQRASHAGVSVYLRSKSK